MKKLLIITLCISSNIFGLSNFEEIYPSIIQTLTSTEVFQGDRHGSFKGNQVAVLSDGSKWKVHPKCHKTYQFWDFGDEVYISKRTSHYWFKREHHFLLNNMSRNESIRVMLVKHKKDPLKIIKVKTYFKHCQPKYKENKDESFFHSEKILESYEYSDPRKILVLSDDSVWVIKTKLNDYQIGMNIYIGSQGRRRRFYDFVLISGTEREASTVWARPQK